MGKMREVYESVNYELVHDIYDLIYTLSNNF